MCKCWWGTPANKEVIPAACETMQRQVQERCLWENAEHNGTRGAGKGHPPPLTPAGKRWPVALLLRARNGHTRRSRPNA